MLCCSPKVISNYTHTAVRCTYIPQTKGVTPTLPPKTSYNWLSVGYSFSFLNGFFCLVKCIYCSSAFPWLDWSFLFMLKSFHSPDVPSFPLRCWRASWMCASLKIQDKATANIHVSALIETAISPAFMRRCCRITWQSGFRSNCLSEWLDPFAFPPAIWEECLLCPSPSSIWCIVSRLDFGHSNRHVISLF